jgi:pyruvate dehydrogenase E2 component (dihydrolipoamide acetyltransferase)
MDTIEVKVPSIGDYKDVPVIEVLVKPGDEVGADDGLVTLESDKATMDVPAPAAGKVRDVRVKVGDRVSEGSVVVTLEAKSAKAGKVEEKKGNGEAGAAKAAPAARAADRPEPVDSGRGAASAPDEAQASRSRRAGGLLEVKVPSLGDFKDVPVIEVLVKAGDTVAADQGLVTLESEKATMDVPSPAAGKVKEVKVEVGDKVKEGTLLAVVETAEAVEGKVEAKGEDASSTSNATTTRTSTATRTARETGTETATEAGTKAATQTGRAAPYGPVAEAAGATGVQAGASARQQAVHASPSVRKLARELGVDLGQVTGTGPRGRIVQADVQGFVKEALAGASDARGRGGAGAGLDLPAWPKVDFAKFGPVETRPLTRIQKLSGPALARNWVMIPHVTQFDEADITELEAFRGELNAGAGQGGVKVTLLAFVMKACVAALRRFPELNASLQGDALVLKRYYHLGFAADTPQGLVVPVVKNADQKGVLDLAREAAELASRAREGKLKADDLQGGTFSISSLGGIGGTAFTPIINAPEVAILGVSRGVTKPVWDGTAFQPRLHLPLSLSYDHRVVDGALAARFTSYLAQVLKDLRRAML